MTISAAMSGASRDRPLSAFTTSRNRKPSGWKAVPGTAPMSCSSPIGMGSRPGSRTASSACPALAEPRHQAHRQWRHHLYAGWRHDAGSGAGFAESLAGLRLRPSALPGGRVRGGRLAQWMVAGQRRSSRPAPSIRDVSGSGPMRTMPARAPPRTTPCARPCPIRSTSAGCCRGIKRSGAHDRTAALGAHLRGSRRMGAAAALCPRRTL